jgi:NADH dehydrogenase [ubiquinone] 1 alpha subcomplex assembly factor 1
VVMGGVSRSAFGQAEPGVARFAGNVSLENFGGFASVRTPPRDWGTAGAAAFVLRVRGDGKSYKFTLRTGDGFDGIQYQARFVAPVGEWTDVRLPVRDFVATFRGRKVPFAPSLDAAKVRALGLMISDKQAGPFELLVDRIAIER